MPVKLEVIEQPRKHNVITIDRDSDISPDQQMKDQAYKLNGIIGEALKDKKMQIPADRHFDEERNDFLEAPELEKIGKYLIEKYEQDFYPISTANIRYLWKRKGGTGGGRATLGKCVKPSSLIRKLSEKDSDGFTEKVDFVVWVAADHCRKGQITVGQIHALIFHELLHADYQNGKYCLRGHDFEGFSREVQEFGFGKATFCKWRKRLRKVKTFKHRSFNSVIADFSSSFKVIFRKVWQPSELEKSASRVRCFGG
ncbi:MAG: hypothetical protein LUM44_17775 [Pyrinomonadaceae bacterium]|nr:hypothetical protein [Pyrinomonadaceae bacterium]